MKELTPPGEQLPSPRLRSEGWAPNGGQVRPTAATWSPAARRRGVGWSGQLLFLAVLCGTLAGGKGRSHFLAGRRLASFLIPCLLPSRISGPDRGWFQNWESTASCSKEMSTLVLDFWNCVPEEILAHVFSYLPFEDRHTAFSVCQSWVKAVSVPSVWSFTEIRCNTEGMDNGCMLERLHQYLCHIKHLKIILDQCQERFRRQVTQILDKLTQKSYTLQALCIVYCGESPYAYSGPDILYSFRLFLRRGNLDLQYIDFRQTSFMLDSETVQLTATSSPNLHTLFINNYACRVTVLKPETIIEVLRTCPKLSSLGVHQATLSEDVLQELLKPSRGPFLFLDIFCDGLDHDIPEELWSALTEKHPQLRVGLELSFLVTPWQIPPILKPNIPVAAMQFNTFIYMARQIRFVTANYSRTLEKLVLDTNPSNALSLALIEMARTCVHLKEIHCSCTVSQGVRDAFLSNCPALIRYTLSTH